MGGKFSKWMMGGCGATVMGSMSLTSEGIRVCRCMVRPVGDKGGASLITTHIGLVCGGSCVGRDIVDEQLVDPCN